MAETIGPSHDEAAEAEHSQNGHPIPQEIVPPLVQIEPARRDLGSRPGLSPPLFEHFRRPVERPFTASERDHTTILLGGLSPRHDKLVEAAVQSLGYDCKALPSVTIDSYTAGRHFGDNGLCNPTYFTVGNLVRYLEELESGGLSRKEIIDSHVFVTAGSCGTCRFGMYEAEYRLALANAGFAGFRVLIFGTHGGIDQSDGEPAGLDMNLDFFLGMITALDVGDVLNQLMHRARSYEVVPGSVDEVTNRVVENFHRIIRERDRYELSDHWTRVFLGTALETPVRYLAKILHLTTSDEITGGMREARRAFDAIELDPFRVRLLFVRFTPSARARDPMLRSRATSLPPPITGLGTPFRLSVANNTTNPPRTEKYPDSPGIPGRGQPRGALGGSDWPREGLRRRHGEVWGSGVQVFPGNEVTPR